MLRPNTNDAVTQARAIAYATTDSVVRTASNWTPAGNLIRAILQDTPYTPAHEVETMVQSDLDDVLLASFLGGGL